MENEVNIQVYGMRNDEVIWVKETVPKLFRMWLRIWRNDMAMSHIIEERLIHILEEEIGLKDGRIIRILPDQFGHFQQTWFEYISNASIQCKIEDYTNT